MNILNIAENHNIQPRRVAIKEYASACPKCGGKDRFRLWPEQGEHGAYWCRQCGIKGDAIQFLRDIDGMSFKEACKTLGRSLQSYKPQPQKPTQPKHSARTAAEPDAVWLEKATLFVDWSHKHLMSAAPSQPLEWLFKRGIGPLAIEKYKLGWNPENIYRPRTAWGLMEIKNDNGIYKKLCLPAGLVIPNSKNGKLQKIRIRRFDGKEPKYYVVPGGGDVVFVAARDTQPKAWVIVENYLDAILIEQEAGDIVGAMAMGSCAAKPAEPEFNMLKKSLCILNALDYDVGKNNAGGNASRWWKETIGDVCERWPVPQGKDPGEAYQKGVNIREWIRAGLPPIFAFCKEK